MSLKEEKHAWNYNERLHQLNLATRTPTEVNLT